MSLPLDLKPTTPSRGVNRDRVSLLSRRGLKLGLGLVSPLSSCRRVWGANCHVASYRASLASYSTCLLTGTPAAPVSLTRRSLAPCTRRGGAGIFFNIVRMLVFHRQAIRSQIGPDVSEPFVQTWSLAKSRLLRAYK